MYNPEFPAGDRTAPAPAIGRTLRIASQSIGLALVLIGAFYAWSVLAASLRFARGSEDLDTALEGMAQKVNLANATLPVGEEKVPIGRSAGAILLVLWYLVTGWLALKLVAVGGQLVLGLLAERREFLAAMKEFLVTLRAEGSAGGPRKSS
jgi:hypothetical protein